MLKLPLKHKDTNKHKIQVFLKIETTPKSKKEKNATKTPIHFTPWDNSIFKILIKSEKYPTG